MAKVDNKRIAKNTLFLYFRMGITMIVNLYAIRVIWRVLGIDDYGIYNVVGGIVLMFQFVNQAMVSSSQRFISFELGVGGEKLREVFSISLKVHCMLALIIFIMAETIGLWFVNYELNIPSSRIIAANWVYQCSVIAFLITVIGVPYNACIVAHEHMKIYGYIGIAEVVLKLGVVFLLLLLPFDKLIAYALLILSVHVFIWQINKMYCKKHFNECSYIVINNKPLIHDMFSFAGWSFVGNLGFSVRDQGLNVIVNMFFNVAMNAAKGIAFQVTNVIRNFGASFQTAINPQIVKLYASGNINEMLLLMTRGCKLSFILVMIISLPLYFEVRYILNIWLGNVNEYVIGFLRLSLIVVLIESIVSPIVTALQATGNIRKFQILISIIMFSNLPISLIWLKYNLDAYAVMWTSIITSLIGVIVRIILLREQVFFPIINLIFNCFIKPVFCCAFCFVILSYLHPLFPKSFLSFILFCGVSVCLTLFFSFVICLSREEKKSIANIISKRFNYNHETRH